MNGIGYFFHNNPIKKPKMFYFKANELKIKRRRLYDSNTLSIEKDGL